MMFLLRSLASAALSYGVAETLLQGHGARARLGRMVSGAVLILSAAVVGCVALAFLLISLFFTLADQGQFIMPALVTALVAAAIVIVLLGEGIRRLRK